MSAEVLAVKQVTQLARQFDDAVHARDALVTQVGQLQASLDASQSQLSAEASARESLEESSRLLERECAGLRENLEEARRTAAALGATLQASEAQVREQRLAAERALADAAEARAQQQQAAEEVSALRRRHATEAEAREALQQAEAVRADELAEARRRVQQLQRAHEEMRGED